MRFMENWADSPRRADSSVMFQGSDQYISGIASSDVFCSIFSQI